MAITRDTQMAGRVRDGELPGRIITDGDEQYILYPDYGLDCFNETDLGKEGFAIMRIDSTDPDDVAIGWANGTKAKANRANSLSTLTYKSLI